MQTRADTRQIWKEEESGMKASQKQERQKQNCNKKKIRFLVGGLVIAVLCGGSFIAGMKLGSAQPVMVHTEGSASSSAETQSGVPTSQQEGVISSAVEQKPTQNMESAEQDKTSSVILRSAPENESPYQDSSSMPGSVRLNVPYIRQDLEFPTGCEVVSATMLLHFYGFDITVDEYIDNYLEISDFAYVMPTEQWCIFSSARK